MDPTELVAHLQRLHTESFGWALSNCGWDEPEAEDVLQTAYSRVLSGKARFGGRSSFRTWFFGVIRNTAQETARRRRKHHQRTESLTAAREMLQQGDGPERQLERAETVRTLRAALQRLSARQREVLHLVFYQDMTIAEAAAVMEVSVGSARTHYERGKARLRTLLKEEGPGEENREGR